MMIAYWVIAAVLAVVYLYSGGMKLLRSKEQLRPAMTWVEHTPLFLVRVIGFLEVLGALGLLLPPLTGIATWLVMAAAIGLVVVQLGAIPLHLRRHEVNVIALNLMLLVLAGVEIWLGTIWL